VHDRERRGWARVGRAAKRILVALATLFFLALGGLLWAVQTGRAAVFVRNELVAQLGASTPSSSACCRRRSTCATSR
jgi:hypothetical protein